MRTILIPEGQVRYSTTLLKVYNYRGVMVYWTDQVEQYLDNLGIAKENRYEQV
jgi:hypothetical protein